MTSVLDCSTLLAKYARRNRHNMNSHYIFKCLILPPGLFVILGIAALFIGIFSKLIARTIFSLLILFWYLLAIPYTPVELAKPLQHYSAIELNKIHPNKHMAIVVLSAGRYFNAPEYGGDTASTISLLRLRYAAKLHQETGIPILLSGGAQAYNAKPDAKLMEEALEQGFQIKARWLENHSANTWQNAVYSIRMLRKDNINTVLLVTSAIHMRRAMFAFKDQNIKVIPAPTYFIQKPNLDKLIYQFIPNRFAFFTSTQCLYEYLGLVWYHFYHE